MELLRGRKEEPGNEAMFAHCVPAPLPLPHLCPSSPGSHRGQRAQTAGPPHPPIRAAQRKS